MTLCGAAATNAHFAAGRMPMACAAEMIRSDDSRTRELSGELQVLGNELLLPALEACRLIRGGGDVRGLVDVRDADAGGDRDHRQQRQRCTRSATADAQPSNEWLEGDVVDAGCRRGRRAVDTVCETQVGHCPDLQW